MPEGRGRKGQVGPRKKSKKQGSTITSVVPRIPESTFPGLTFKYNGQHSLARMRQKHDSPPDHTREIYHV